MGVRGITDIWEYAKENDHALVTKDKDFYQRSALVGNPPKVNHLTLGNCSMEETAAAILERSGHVKVFLKHPTRTYLPLPES